ncbi:non-ribosomal peptide synthetase [Dactylosporangium sp. NPDC000244]|uniref:non-ribosomal peptide synthetase n=1 Tax=Dactylosporangium sp. NPDC000244 TaxID=3154365 RepID=UPI00331E2A66
MTPAQTAVAVQDLIWYWADTAPETTAVIDTTGAAVTYQELADAADAAAADLAAGGVTAEHVVGVAYPRAVDGLVQLLGVWRAGGAVLCLDPAWPVARLRDMIARCGVRHLRTARPIPGLTAPAPHTGIGIGADAVPAVRGPLCYVVCTSGSTGTPRGVLIEHPGAVNMATALADRFAVGPGTRVLQFAAWSWDAAMGEILMTLTAGGTLVLAPPHVRHGGPALARLLRDARVEVATLTPSVLAALPAHNLPDLRTVVAVGEVCPPRLVTRWTAPHRRVCNGYGPTETTVAATIGDLRPGEPVHIGTPLPGVTVQVVDHHDQPLPTGMPGELLIGGIGVARGYAADPAATAARFTTDPAGRRWYRTGDLAARRGDGTLTFLGRADDQIKVRGHRIDPAEVEHVLAGHPAVAACAVVTTGHRLTAYIVTSHAPTTAADVARAAEEIRGHAAAVLPAFAVPATVRVVAALPLTDGGKTDRDALRHWATSAATPAPAQDPPAEGTLPRVLQVVAAALDQPVDADTDVIDAGGHSLLIAQLCVALSDTFAVDVPYLTVARNPTPAGLAAAIDELTATGHTAGGVPSAAA